MTRHKEATELFVARNTAKDLKELARQVSRSDETRAASMFYQQNPIGPVRPMNAAEILAQFASETIGRTAARMEHERDHAHHYRAPAYHRQDNQPPARDSGNIPASRSADPAEQKPDAPPQQSQTPYSRWGDDPSPAPDLGQRGRRQR